MRLSELYITRTHQMFKPEATYVAVYTAGHHVAILPRRLAPPSSPESRDKSLLQIRVHFGQSSAGHLQAAGTRGHSTA